MTNGYEMNPMEKQENMVNELTTETAALETTETEEAAREQQEMDNASQAGESQEVLEEQREMDEGGKLGYSSDYYQHQMANAIKNGNKIAYENNRRYYAEELAREKARDMARKTR